MRNRLGMMSVIGIAAMVISLVSSLGSSSRAGSALGGVSSRTGAGSSSAPPVRGAGLGREQPGEAMQSGEGTWVRQEVLSWEEVFEDEECYHSNSFTIADGSYSSSKSWDDCGGGSSSGSFSFNGTWSTPPSRLKAGEEVTIRASLQGTASTRGDGRRTMTSFISIRYTKNPGDSPHGFYQWSHRILHLEGGGWNLGTDQFPFSISTEERFTVPAGQPGDVLVLVFNPGHPGGRGAYTHSYVFKESTVPRGLVIGGIGAVVVGGLAIAAVAVGRATRSRRRRPRQRRKETEKEKEEPRDKDPVGYILQLSRNRLEVRHGGAAQLGSAVWAVDTSGQYTLASDAHISLVPPPGIAALPSEGQGRLSSRIEVLDAGLSGERVMGVKALVGSEQHQAEVVLSIQGDYRIEFF